MTKFTKNKKVYEENINNLSARASTIVFPDSNREITNILKLSSKEIDIVSRGFGVSFSSASTPLAKNNSVIIDFSKMKKIISINALSKFAIVEPGVLVSDLNEELLKYNLEFPIIPLFEGLETIGSMIAKNSSGSREVKYNRTINWLESIEIINGLGEEVKVSKSDLSDFVGMEGTTGIITKAILKLTNKKKRSLTILKSDKLSDIFAANKRLRLKQDVCSIDFFNKEISVLLGLENKYHLFVEFDTEEGFFRQEDYEKFIKIKTKAYKKIAGEGFYHLDSIKLFSESIEDYFIYLEEKKIPYFAFLASGVVFLCSGNDEKSKNKIYEALSLGNKQKAKISYTLGYGLLRKEFLDKGEADLLNRVRTRHDPNCRLNRDKFLGCSKTNFNSETISQDEYLEKEQLEKENTTDLEVLENPGETTNDTQKDPSINITPNQDLSNSCSNDVLEQNNPPTQESPQLKQAPLNAQDLIDNAEKFTLKRKDDLSPEQKEQIKKLASGFFSGQKKQEES